MDTAQWYATAALRWPREVKNLAVKQEVAERVAEGRALPFVLQPMRVRQIRLPAMQMIYCPDVADYVACAGAFGRFLLPRGRISVALDANGRIEDLVGLYREPLGRKYFKGPQRPRLADLTDTELVLYGP